MDLLSIILIAVGLAMDCFAVSIAQGLNRQSADRPRPVLMAALFGLFQGGMPLIGYFAGSVFAAFFDRYAPWIALALLACIGGKMIRESMHEDEAPATGWSWSRLLMLAVATSIDALATGLIFIPVPERLWLGVSIIGVVSLLFSLGGYMIGRFVGRSLRLNVTMIGGIILVLIGVKIWLEGCTLN